MGDTSESESVGGNPDAGETLTEDERYEDYSEQALVDLAYRRGLGTLTEIVTRALIEQDCCHAGKRFPFLSLPGELRNSIYAEAFSCKSYKRSNLDLSEVGLVGLRGVNSLIRQESLGFFLGHNTFELQTELLSEITSIPNRPGDTHLSHWLTSSALLHLRLLGHHTGHFRNLMINLKIDVKRTKEDMGLHILLERKPSRVPEFRARVSAEYGPGYGTDEESAMLRREVIEYVEHHAQSYIDRERGSFALSARKINRLLLMMPISYDI